MKKIIPEKLFDLTKYEKVCPIKNFVPLMTFDIELFIKRHDVILNFEEEEFPFDVKFTGELEYCGKEDNLRLYKIPFGKNKNDLIFLVDSDNLISKIALKVNVSTSESALSLAGMTILILRNSELNLEEFQEMIKLIKDDENIIFHWSSKTERFIFLDRFVDENNFCIGFFAAVE